MPSAVESPLQALRDPVPVAAALIAALVGWSNESDDGSLVLITGGSSGIGLAIAQQLFAQRLVHPTSAAPRYGKR